MAGKIERKMEVTGRRGRRRSVWPQGKGTLL